MENSPGATMWILLLIVIHAGAVRLSPVSVSRGETAHIPCVFGEGTVRNIYWKFNNSTTELKVVNVVGGEPRYFHDDYEGRADVDNGDKSTLILSAITVRDGGDYCCDVDRFQDTAVYDICTQLLVSGPSPVIPQCEPAECQIEAPVNADINIRCELRKISRADDVTLEWYDERGELLNSTKDEVQDDEGDGFHTLVSTATVNVLEETHFSCNSSLTTPTGTERDGVEVLVVPTIAPGSTNSPTDDPGNKADVNLPAIIVPVVVAVVVLVAVLLYFLYRKRTRGYTEAPTCETELTEARHPRPTDDVIDNSAETGRDTGGASGTEGDPSTETAAGSSNMTSTEKVTDEQIEHLSTIVPVDKYYAFCLNINKTGLNKAEGILKSNQKDYKDAIRSVLSAWKTKTGGTRVDLEKAMKKAEIGGLIEKIFP